VQLIEDVEKETKDQTGFTLHLAVDYGGKDEVSRAVQKIMNQERPFSGAVTEDLIRQHLDHPELPDIDVILRSSGEQRTSNFFLWQAAYSEWVFNPKHFPDINTSDLDDALNTYADRKRRFGK
jgi:undecaprenyl diphosphate synthase